ncbi:MAG: hypothetical protein ACLQU3_02400 [Limisphaerales bacterium]
MTMLTNTLMWGEKRRRTNAFFPRPLLQLMTRRPGKRTAPAGSRLAAALVLLFLTVSAQAATWYVDGSVASSGNGQSWATAWKNLSNVTGISAGDTVYISGGPSGSSQTYSVPSWTPTQGSGTSSRITYQIGQDSSHNGTAIFSGSGTWLGGDPRNINILGYVTNDAAMHFQLSGYSSLIQGYNAGGAVYYLRLGYINFGQISGEYAVQDSNDYGIEIDHTWIQMTSSGADVCYHFMNGSVGTAYGQNLYFHNNSVYVPKVGHYSISDGGGIGTDGIQTGCGGLTICSNLFVAVPTAGGINHQDFWQAAGDAADYTLVYNNIFYESGESACYIGASGGPWNHTYIFNNIAICCNFGIDVNPETYNDCVIANNLFADMNGANYQSPLVIAGSPTFASSYLFNQIDYNDSESPGNPSGLVQQYNVTPSSSAFANYIFDSTNSNYHLTSSATSLIGKGTNLTSFANADPALAPLKYDMDGNLRPATGNWDIGPYQYSSGGPGTNAAISVSPGSLNFGSVATDVTVTNYFTVQNVGSGILAGTATVAAPFNIVSGGTYSLGSNQTQTVSVSYSPSGPNNSQVVTFTGGGGATATVSGSLLVVQSGLSFESYAGTITAPFNTNGGYVSQAVLATAVASGGTASYYFNITNAGQYIVEASVLAPNSGTKSFWVNVDAIPVDPTMIWDIYPYSTNWQTVPVSWRGNSTTITNDQYNPEVFNLTSGVHDLIIVGREANVGLGQITIAPYSAERPSPPAPPQALRVVVNP